MAVLYISGCAATNSGVNTQFTRYFNINPPMKNQNVVYVQVQDSTGQNLSFQQRIAGAIKAKGYPMTKYPEKAYYVFQGNVIHAGEIESDVLDFAYQTKYGDRIVRRTAAAPDMIAVGLQKLTKAATAKSQCIIFDIKLDEYHLKNGKREMIRRITPKTTRIVSGITGRGLPETVIQEMSDEVVQKASGLF
jgi:hypothetical protein